MFGVRLDPELDQRLDALARATNRSRSALVREALSRYLDGDSFLAEARRQSLLASAHPQEQEILDMLHSPSDVDGWK